MSRRQGGTLSELLSHPEVLTRELLERAAQEVAEAYPWLGLAAEVDEEALARARGLVAEVARLGPDPEVLEALRAWPVSAEPGPYGRGIAAVARSAAHHVLGAATRERALLEARRAVAIAEVEALRAMPAPSVRRLRAVRP